MAQKQTLKQIDLVGTRWIKSILLPEEDYKLITGRRLQWQEQKLADEKPQKQIRRNTEMIFIIVSGRWAESWDEQVAFTRTENLPEKQVALAAESVAVDQHEN